MISSCGSRLATPDLAWMEAIAPARVPSGCGAWPLGTADPGTRKSHGCSAPRLQRYPCRKAAQSIWADQSLSLQRSQTAASAVTTPSPALKALPQCRQTGREDPVSISRRPYDGRGGLGLLLFFMGFLDGEIRSSEISTALTAIQSSPDAAHAMSTIVGSGPMKPTSRDCELTASHPWHDMEAAH